MSKLDYSASLSDIIYGKLKSVHIGYATDLLEDNDLYKLALSIAYLTLSKEKIIDKDKKNTDKIGRLNKHVKTIDIDTVFDSSFSNKPPIIIEAEEYDKLWILDNFRDSIMHGVFDIDLENKVIYIDNREKDRKLKAEISFDWLYDYAKYDIRSKKEKDHYTFIGMYKNVSLANKKHLNRDWLLRESIFYKVTVEGDKPFNVKQVENRIRYLFNIYFDTKIDPDKEGYLTCNRYNYPEYEKNYYCSFVGCRERIIEQIKHEFDLDVKIGIVKNKKKISNKAKTINEHPYIYQEYCDNINKICIRKSDKMLDMLSLIIENIGNKPQLEDGILYDEKLIMTHFEEYLIDSQSYFKYDFDKLNINKSILASVLVTVFGISTIVINNDYLEKLLNDTDYLQSFEVYSKPYTIENANRLNKLHRLMLETNQKYNEAVSNFKKCKSIKGLEHLKGRIKDLRDTMIDQATEYQYIKNIMKKEFDLDKNAKNEIRELEEEKFMIEYLNDIANLLAVTSGNVKTPLDKEKIDAIEKKIKDIEDGYIFDRCYYDKEKLKVIRNSLSHIGRIAVSPKRNGDMNITFIDFDDENHLSGCGYVDYKEFLLLISRMFEDHKVKVMK